MACSVTNGRKIPCKSSVGGIRNIFFAPYSDVTAALVPDGTGLVTLNDSEEFFKYEVKGNSSLETAITSSRENGTTFFETTLNATFTFLDIATQEQIKLLSRGRPQIVIEDYNGNAFLIGKDNGADVNGGTIVTGAAMGDLSGFTLTLVAQENEPPFFLAALPDDDSTTPINPTP
tara:strand:+ start:44 stop:568 length:525 start_codon:yes stop_codon:yes gene_type:complete